MIQSNLYIIAGVLKDTCLFINDPLAKKDVESAIYMIKRALRRIKESNNGPRTSEDNRRRVDKVINKIKEDKALLNRHGIRILPNIEERL
jgi:hypothetical protein